MNYIKYSYLLFSLAVISGIIIFNNLPEYCKEKVSGFLLPLMIIIIFLIIIFTFTVFIKKDDLVRGRASVFFLLLLMILFMLLAFSSSCLSFSRKIIIQKNIFEITDSKDIRKLYNIEISGRISSHPYIRTNNYYFELGNAALTFTDKLSGKKYQLNNINEIFISYDFERYENSDFIRDDMVKITVDDIKKHINRKGEKEVVFYTENAEKTEDSFFLLYFYKIRRKIFNFLSKKFSQCLSSENYSFASALLLGNQNKLSQSLKDSFMKSGLYHILSISGLHLSILFSIVPLFLSKLNFLFPKKMKNIISFLCFVLLVFFNMLIGLKAAMMRASVFFAIYSISGNSRKYNLPVNIFFMALIIMLLIFPEFLSDTGFILSFCATAGIIIVSPIIKKLFSLLPEGRYLAGNYFAKILIVNVSVNIFILPLSFYYFGGYYILSFLSNMICTPVFYMTLVLLFTGSVSVLFLPFAGEVFIKISSWFINILLNLSYFFSGSSFGYVQSDFFIRPLNIFLYYLLLAFLILAANYFLPFKSKMKIKNVV
ncbi:MAG TPA: hypothetical protein DCY00_04470 [Actinobacteria bacterium]|nr:hypothetical protein [Actinomycetota bacterium]